MANVVGLAQQSSAPKEDRGQGGDAKAGGLFGLFGFLNGDKKASGPGGDPTSGVWGSSFNLLNTIVGDGVVAIPWAMDQSGLVAGVFLVCGVGLLTDLTVNMIVESGVRHGNLSYEGAVAHVLGKKGRRVCQWAIAITAYGAMISYAVIVGDTVGTIVSGDTTPGERALIIFLFSLVAILPLCMLRDMASLESSSTLSIFCNIVVAVLVVALAPDSARDQGLSDVTTVSYVNLPTLPKGLAVVAFAFVCHHATFAVRNSLSDPTPQRWRKVTHISVSSGFIITVLLGIGAYMSFGDAIEEDVLNSFEVDDLGANFARAFLAATMIFTFPMEHFVARHIVYTLIFQPESEAGSISPTRGLLREMAEIETSALSLDGADERSSTSSEGEDVAASRGATEEDASHIPQRYFVGITLALWGSATVIAMATNKLGFVLSLTGSIGASIVGFIFPSLVYYKTFQDELSWLQKLGTLLVFVFGVVMLVLGTAVTIIDEVHNG